MALKQRGEMEAGGRGKWVAKPSARPQAGLRRIRALSRPRVCRLLADETVDLPWAQEVPARYEGTKKPVAAPAYVTPYLGSPNTAARPIAPLVPPAAQIVRNENGSGRTMAVNESIAPSAVQNAPSGSADTTPDIAAWSTTSESPGACDFTCDGVGGLSG